MNKKIILMCLVFAGFSLSAFAEKMQSLGLASPKKQYADIVRLMEDLTRQYPQNVEIFDLGDSDSGQKIKGLRIGTGALENLVVATHHGNEYGSTEVALAFATSLAAQPIMGQSIYVIPVLNIKGYNSGRREEPNYVGRSFDPNRDYIGPCKDSGTFGNSFNLKSTSALAEFLRHTNIISSATLHTYHPGVLYPWGISTRDLDTGYTDVFLDMGAAATGVSNYLVGNSTDVLYPAEGTFEDYAFWQYGIWSMLFELGFTHFPSEKQVQEMIAVNVPGLRKMFEATPLVRAPRHNFAGQCTRASILLDRRDE